ncbi:MAG: sodium:solute symporter [Prolixibacteraceae bacterium]|jgi:solute:Na+ symporter, SSS family|nr:sodium:solute symporter [Prolixibacteraceae bacterium]MBT6004166.1 sodium:solute symporter [Prolixibacteraceae bacterium]MBT6763487.1 sodium:solute symporter [Prolixibacteraceae bacterium]MBT7000297.1 sodium:solute symporter [Prolixibacteraceae bacterium]MBT7394036.1 sodium:solute symporter [Prolixibacteraceae bacterium]
MNPYLVLGIILGYFFVLMFISWLTSRNADTQAFFTANRKSPWFLVAFGMVGATLSGVTFISVPGEVGNTAFSYLQFVFGNIVGYWLVAGILLPLYYRLNLVSIYSFLEQRFGVNSYKTGSFFFLISKLIGAAFRLYLVAGVLQIAFFDAFNIPFSLTVIVTIALIWVYTFRGGIKTIVWTDTLQTLFLVSAVIFTIVAISKNLGWDSGDLFNEITKNSNSKIFFWDWRSGNNFFKQFFAGMAITIVMVGMDQDMMQKNLTCKNKKEAQKNMLVFSFSFLITVFLFLGLGVLLFIYAEKSGITVPENTDDLYPLLALNHFGLPVGIAFLLGITAAAYSSADSALTALTTSFSIDFLKIEKYEEHKKQKIKKWSHLFFSVLLILLILLFRAINNESIVVAVFRVAGYTYGPILGLFVFGIYSKRKVNDKWIPFVGILAPILSFFISKYSEIIFNGYKFGFELLILNGLLTIVGLFLFSKKYVLKD